MFCHTFRFINDLITINNKNFEKNMRNIYPAKLKLQKENQININTNFVDLTIIIANSRFQARVYGK